MDAFSYIPILLKSIQYIQNQLPKTYALFHIPVPEVLVHLEYPGICM